MRPLTRSHSSIFIHLIAALDISQILIRYRSRGQKRKAKEVEPDRWFHQASRGTWKKRPRYTSSKQHNTDSFWSRARHLGWIGKSVWELWLVGREKLSFAKKDEALKRGLCELGYPATSHARDANLHPSVQPQQLRLGNSNPLPHFRSDGVITSDDMFSNTGGSSLFGGAASTNNNNNNNQTQNTGGGLFGAKPAAAPATGGGLFGGASPAPAASTGQLGGSLFGSTLGGTSQPAAPAAGGGLFGGGAAAAKPATSGLFGTPAATSQPAAPSTGGGLFGGGAAAKPASGGLFGASTAQPATSQPAAGGSSLFGAPQNQAQGQDAGKSLFGGLGQSTNNNTQNQNQQAMTNEAAPANPAYFDQLLERGRKRQTEERITPFGELPALELGLADISRKVRNLGQGGPSAGLTRRGDARAHYLLSASGVNTGQALRDLERLAEDTVPAGAPSAQAAGAATGVRYDLARRHQDDFQAMVDGRVQKAQDDFNKMIEEKMGDVDWAAQHQRIYEHFGLKKPQGLDTSARESKFGPSESGAFGRTSRRSRFGASKGGKSFGVPGLARSVIGTPGARGVRQSQFADVQEKLPADGMRVVPEDRILRMKQNKYTDRVKELNIARIQERAYPLLNKFADVESEPSGEDNTMLVHAFKALAEITGEDASKESWAEPGAIKPRHYARDYLDETPNAKGPSGIRSRIINGSRSFLEKSYFSQVETTVVKNPREANVGGVPTALAKVKGYARVRAIRRELGPDLEILQKVNDDYCWVVLFYLIRCGLIQEGWTYVEDNMGAFRNIDRKFIAYFRAFVTSPDRRLPPNLQTDINNDYAQRARMAPEDTIDPYRMMVFKIIGRCDLGRRNFESVNSDMMDWLWLQFALAREYSRVDEFAHEAYGLDELRTSIKDIGDRYFGPNSDLPNAPTTFFFMQTLAGLFEKAIADLYPNNYMSAVHFAIALDYYGLLRVSDISSSDDLLTYTTRQRPQIAFGSMTGLYTRDFRTADPAGAVDYLSLICLNADLEGTLGKAQRELCHQALTELVLETREFAVLLGDIRADGQRIKGSIEQRLQLIGIENELEFLRHITLVAARTAEDQSRTTDAALLYHLAEDYDKVVQIVNDAVSLSLTTEIGDEPQRLTPLKPRQREGEQVPREMQGSLSLTAVDDPVELSRNFRNLYNSAAMYYGKINETTAANREILLHLADARRALEAGQWPIAVDVSPFLPVFNIVHSTNSPSQCIERAKVLPTDTAGNMTAIRAKAQAFNCMQPVVARTIGHIMIWAVVALANEHARLKGAEFDTPAQQNVIAQCKSAAKDVMVFAGLIRYKLPGRVWETLAQAGQELGQ
jgi:nuclear pore complex protein Nup93